MAYLELEEIIHSLETSLKEEKSLKNKCLYENAIKCLKEIHNRKKFV
jgi:hypothetical protein